MAKPKTRAQLELENKLLRSDRVAQGIASVARELVRWVGIGTVAFFAYKSIVVLAGKTTSSNIVFSLLTDLKANQYFGLIFGGGGILYGYKQKKLRKKTVERLQSRIQVFEKDIDDRRSSSTLTSTGDTRPEDKL